MTVTWLDQEWEVEDRRASSTNHLTLTNEDGFELIVFPESKQYATLVERIDTA